MRVESIVIVRWPKGWVVHLRFSDPRQNESASCDDRWQMYSKIEWILNKKGVKPWKI